MLSRWYRGVVLALTFIPSIFASDPVEPAIDFTHYASLGNNTFGAFLIADFNSDERPDLVSEVGIRFFTNNGTNFTGSTATNFNEGFDYPLPLAVADFDNDSDIDVFFTREGRLFDGGILRPHFYSPIIWNTGGMRFTHLEPLPFQPLVRGATAAADFDNDGDSDLVTSGNPDIFDSPRTNPPFATRLYENVGSHQFAAHPMTLRGVEEGTLSWADHDSDGDLDLFLCGRTNSNTFGNYGATILYRNDHGQLTNSGHVFPRLTPPYLTPISVSWGDYDNDSDLDLLVAGNTNNHSSPRPYAAIFRNDGASFTVVNPGVPALTRTPAAVWADFDSDGDLDIILSQPYTSQSQLLANNGDGTFQTSRSLGITLGHMVLGDFDSDGRIDLGSYHYDLPGRIYRNITPRTNTPPLAPTNPAAVQTSGSVTFSWDPAVDTEQTNGLTYNLRIGTSPGSSDILSAMASTTNGYRYITALGNTGLRTNWTIHKFRNVTYYWSVQAIDHGCAASEFAAEQTITISNVPPVVEIFSITNATASSATVAIRLHTNFELADYYLEFTSSNHTGTSIIRHSGAAALDLSCLFLLPGLDPSTEYQVRVVASNLFGVTYTSPRIFTTAPAAPLTQLPTAFSALSGNPTFLPIDIDQDGDLDVIHSGSSNSMSGRAHQVFMNDAGIFSRDRDVQVSGPGPVSITAGGDFNNDSYIDLLFAGSSRGVILLRDGAEFSPAAEFPLTPIHQTFPDDSDNDGDLDLFTLNDFLGPYLHLNDNVDAFRTIVTRHPRAQIAEWGDYDNDGDNDLLIFGITNPSINKVQSVTRILRNDGANVFIDAQANLPGAALGASWIDYDNDLDLDVLLITTNTSNLLTNDLKLFRNDHTNGFTEVATILSEPDITLFGIIDFNRDDRLDFFLYQDLALIDKLRFFQNEADGEFIERDLGLPLLTNFQARFADFDGDHMPDILVQARASNVTQLRLQLFRNNLVSTNSLSPVPIDLTAIAARASATLHWKLPEPESTDNSNGIAYTYNLRISTNRFWDINSATIMSPMSHRETGALQLPKRGNAGQGLSWTVRDLPPGTYHWSVQSIDHAFNGSPFSKEHTFTIEPGERTLQILSFSKTNVTHRITADGPTRSRARLHLSYDLITWQTNYGYVYIGGDPGSTTLNDSANSAFFRLQLDE